VLRVHELSIAISLIEVAEQEAHRRGARTVVSIRLRLGPLSGVMKDALISAYGLAREETAMAKAELIVHETPIRLYCKRCVAEREARSMQMLCCAVCGEPSNEIVSGRELEIMAMEIET
jgi:hydrogenase nickel incorporation protein HypA/HybF